MIKSKDNPSIRRVRKLLAHSSFRDEERKFVIEGVKIIHDILISPSAPERVLSSIFFSERIKHQKTGYQVKCGDTASLHEILLTAKRKGVPCMEVADTLMRQMRSLKTDQGIIAVSHYIDRSSEEIIDSFARNDSKKRPLMIGACGIQDPGNLGALVRTAHAGGAAGLLLFESCADIYNPKTVRGSMGSIFFAPLARNLRGEEILPKVRKKGIKIYGTVSDRAQCYTDVDLDAPLLLLFGSEGKGIPESYMKYVDETLSIPMLGGADSLNVNASAAIIIFERLRRIGEKDLS